MLIATIMTLFADGIWDNIGDKIGEWASTIFSFIFLAIDGVTYSALAYSYKLFELMARMNFSSLLNWFAPIMQRINSLILVVVMFVLGYSLIVYLINPDKIQDKKIGGVALIKNIAIASVLLIIYKSVFISISDATFLLIGAPDGYQYNTEEGIGAIFDLKNDGSPGLIQNLIFGSSDNAEEEQEDFASSFAVNVLKIFLDDKGSTATILDDTYRNVITGKDFNFMPIVGAAYEINFFDSSGNVKYEYPIISTLVGLYLIYTIVTIAIEIGVRAFKLVILEILAPIAIITIIYGGWEAKIWKNWLSVFGKTFFDIFMRVGIMFFVVAFINTAWGRIGELFSYEELSMTGFTSFLLTILIVISGFKLAKELPKFLDNILGTKLAENNKSGFTNFLGGLAGGIAGVATGIGAAKALGLSAPMGAFNALKGGITGAASGSKGQKISEHINNIGKNRDSIRSGAETMKSRGGTLGSNLGYGLRQVSGANYAGQKRTEAAIKDENDRYAGLQYQHNQRVEAENNRHEIAAQGYQDTINTHQESLRLKEKSMKTADSSIIDSRTGSAIKFDENYMKNAVEGDQFVRDAKATLAEKQERLNTLIQSGAPRAMIDIQQTAVKNAENHLALCEQTATQYAIQVKKDYENLHDITSDKEAIQRAQQDLNTENSTHTTNVRTENDSFKTVTEAHETTVKGAPNPTTGKRSGGLESQLKRYGGKPQ